METAIKELKKLFITLLVLDTLIIIITLVAGAFDMSVVFGILYGLVFTVLSFVLLGSVVERALSMDERRAKRHMRINFFARYILTAIILLIPFLNENINAWCVVVAMLSPKLTYFAIGFFDLLPKRKGR